MNQPHHPEGELETTPLVMKDGYADGGKIIGFKPRTEEELDYLSQEESDELRSSVSKLSEYLYKKLELENTEKFKAKLAEVLEKIYLEKYSATGLTDQFKLGFDKAVELIEDQKSEIRNREGLV